MGELVGTGCAMNSKASKTLLLLLSLAIFASTSGQPRSARQDEAGETNLLNDENLENDADATPEENGEESDQNKGTPEPEPETEPEPEPEGSAGHAEGNPENSDDMNPQENSSKKCKKCFRSAFRARHSEFCEDCGDTSNSDDDDEKPLEKDADRWRRKCRRCSNPKFAEKRQNLCKSSRCKDLQESEPTPTPEPEHRPITGDDLKKSTKKKTKKERKKGQKKTNKKKGVKLPDEEEEEKEIAELTANKPTEQVLGPLGNLIKFLIQQNTFAH